MFLHIESLVNLFEHENKRANEHAVDLNKSHEKVPSLHVWPVAVHHIPRQWNLFFFFILVFIFIFNFTEFAVGLFIILLYFFYSMCISDFVMVLFGLRPELVYPNVFLSTCKAIPVGLKLLKKSLRVYRISSFLRCWKLFILGFVLSLSSHILQFYIRLNIIYCSRLILWWKPWRIRHCLIYLSILILVMIEEQFLCIFLKLEWPNEHLYCDLINYDDWVFKF